ncbi:leukocyte immunoglobulin-like receptor subfamily A member 2 isoform X2 [Rhineura floridana]|nr:leukocyte immunoglobulin-like receptor subfamily A member 2 isoform X2 [Rhineura floridana]XP_061444828.1 leukocyte immunoglobulin-like receptor subfamily A member 2 isoform X2 [Rhineura floridana]XP_061444829.1 leukocyte immunoglobulin-like receptor subfamily A member 2 isoform X2 [Rhineura floridana]
MWASVGQFYHKPSISVSPSEVVPLGGNATINCKNELYREAAFYLIKEGISFPLQAKNTEQYEVQFSIANVKESDSGIYWCKYHFKSERVPMWSALSDSIHINITDTSSVENNIRLGVAGFVLLALALIVAEAIYSWRSGQL